MGEWKKRKKKMEIPQMKEHRKLTCTVCGEEFYPKDEDRYVTAENKTSGGLAGALSGTVEGPELYDSFDCPFCGCQIVVKGRLRNARIGEIAPDIVERDSLDELPER